MSRIVVTPGAARGLERCRQFLAEKSPAASKRAAQAIRKQFDLLETQPGVGRPLEEEPDLRELVISFGDSGYDWSNTFLKICLRKPRGVQINSISDRYPHGSRYARIFRSLQKDI